nr:MAG TPA: hypothetical protein [Caudoviricetes sp.]
MFFLTSSSLRLLILKITFFYISMSVRFSNVT